jgi:hypothetical protein
MYSKISKEEDDELVDRWQKDADGIIIFVSPFVDIYTNAHTNQNILDWSVLCCGGYITLPVSPGSEAQFSRYFCVLSWQYISDSHRHKQHHITYVHYFPCRSTTPILSLEICCLGEFTLVYELGD